MGVEEYIEDIFRECGRIPVQEERDCKSEKKSIKPEAEKFESCDNSSFPKLDFSDLLSFIGEVKASEKIVDKDECPLTVFREAVNRMSLRISHDYSFSSSSSDDSEYFDDSGVNDDEVEVGDCDDSVPSRLAEDHLFPFLPSSNSLLKSMPFSNRYFLDSSSKFYSHVVVIFQIRFIK
jgi:hypothetical protein